MVRQVQEIKFGEHKTGPIDTSQLSRLPWLLPTKPSPRRLPHQLRHRLQPCQRHPHHVLSRAQRIRSPNHSLPASTATSSNITARSPSITTAEPSQRSSCLEPRRFWPERNKSKCYTGVTLGRENQDQTQQQEERDRPHHRPGDRDPH